MSTKDEPPASSAKWPIAMKDTKRSPPHVEISSSKRTKLVDNDNAASFPLQNIGNACANNTVNSFVNETNPTYDDADADSSIQQRVREYAEAYLPSSLRKYLFPKIEEAKEEDKAIILYLYKKILQDRKILEILLLNWNRWGMEEQFSKLMEGAVLDHGKDNVEKLESIISRYIREGMLAEKNGDFIYVLKCCLDEYDKIKNREEIASMLGLGRDAWLLKMNRDLSSEYTGQRLTANDMYDRKSKTTKAPYHLIEYEYTPMGTCFSQHANFLGEQIGTMWMLAVYSTLTVNRNCYWCISDNCKSTQHQHGMLRVSAREGIMNGQLGIYNDWSETVVRALGMKDHLFTLKKRKSGESSNPDAWFIQKIDLLKIYYQKHVLSKGVSRSIWVVEPKKCDDYNSKNSSSNLYNFWSDIFGLTSKKKLILSPWQLSELEKIEIYPDRVEEVKAAQTKRRVDSITNRLQTTNRRSRPKIL
jgi:hypothetical protein